jgi:Mg-chelatase subunit ChlD
LIEGVQNLPYVDAHVFCLADDGVTVLGHSRTMRNPNSGRWQITSLPASGKVILVGFHDSLKSNMWVEEFDLRGRYEDLGRVRTSMAMAGSSPDKIAGGGPLQILALAGWIAGEINAANANDRAVTLADRLMDWLAAQNRVVGCESVDLAMLIDSSGSMKDNDPRGLRREAATLLIDRSPPQTIFTVIDFDSSASVKVSRSSDVAATRAAAQSVDANGGTDIESALRAGYQALAMGSGPRAAILFTDGRSDRRGGTDGFVKDGIPVHVVGLGNGVDTEYLQRLAASTNGLYMHAATAGDLAQVFDRAISELACEGTVYSRDGVIRPGERIEHPFVVDATIATLTARVTWPGSRIDLELIDPNGAPAGVEVGSGSTYRIVEVNNPQAGKWTARVVGTQVASSGEPYTFRAGGPSNLRLAASQADPKDPTKLKFTTIDHGVGAKVMRTWSRVERPDRKTVDGPTLSSAGQDTWTLSVPIDKAGIYTVTAGLAGSLRDGAEWVRESTRTVVIGQGMVPWRGVITRVEGQYLTINRGSRHGVREGMSVTLRPGRNTAGSGLVISVSRSSSTVELQELWGSAMAERGMSIELDRTQWMADTRW